MDNAGNAGNGSTSFTVKVTYGSLYTVTTRFIQSSSKYQALPGTARTAADQAATSLCSYLSTAQIALTAAQKAAAIAAYRQGVQALETV